MIKVSDSPKKDRELFEQFETIRFFERKLEMVDHDLMIEYKDVLELRKYKQLHWLNIKNKVTLFIADSVECS